MITLHAKKDRKACHGRGVVYDSVQVPFGHGNCSMPSDCDCAYEDISDYDMGAIDSGADYEILPEDA